MPPRKRILILLAGVAGAGKTYLAHKIRNSGIFPSTTIIGTDWYFHRGVDNYDVLNAVDRHKLLSDIQKLEENHPVTISYREHRREASETISWSDALIVEGIHALTYQPLVSRADLCIYLDADRYLAGARRILRDVLVYGDSPEDALERLQLIVLPSIHKTIEPQRHVADINYRGDEDWPELVDRLTKLNSGK